MDRFTWFLYSSILYVIDYLLNLYSVIKLLSHRVSLDFLCLIAFRLLSSLAQIPGLSACMVLHSCFLSK